MNFTRFQNNGTDESTLRKYERVAKVTPDSLWLAYEIAKGKGDLETAKGYGEMMMSLFPSLLNVT